MEKKEGVFKFIFKHSIIIIIIGVVLKMVIPQIPTKIDVNINHSWPSYQNLNIRNH